MAEQFKQALVIAPSIEATLRKSAGRHCVYLARLVHDDGSEWRFEHPSGVRASILNIGEGVSFVDRWLAAKDKARRIHDLAEYLKSYAFRIEVDAYATQPQTLHLTIERVLERCFMASCGCAPFFQEVRGKPKDSTSNKEAWLFRSSFLAATHSEPSKNDFLEIESRIGSLMDEAGWQRWNTFKARVAEFFERCDSSHNDVGISFDTSIDPTWRVFGTSFVKGLLGRLPVGPNGISRKKHCSKVACFKALQSLAESLRLPALDAVRVGQNGDHGTLALNPSGDGGYIFRKGVRVDRDVVLDKDGVVVCP